jgi:PadR family transcriptional regulator
MTAAVIYTTSYYEVVSKKMKYGRELLKGSTDHLLLSIIGQEPIYGYQLIKEIGKRSGGYFQFKEGTLYTALHRLEREGLIEGKWKRLSTGQERRYYYLTKLGHSVLDEKRDEWRGFSAAVNLVTERANTG